MQSKKSPYIDPHSMLKLDSARSRDVFGHANRPTIEEYNKAIAQKIIQGSPIEPPRNVFSTISPKSEEFVEKIIDTAMETGENESAPPAAKKKKTVKSVKKIEKVYRIEAAKPSRAKKKVVPMSKIVSTPKKAATKSKVKPAAVKNKNTVAKNKKK